MKGKGYFDFLEDWTLQNKVLFWAIVVLILVLIPWIFYMKYQGLELFFPITPAYSVQNVEQVYTLFDFLGVQIPMTVSNFMLLSYYQAADWVLPVSRLVVGHELLWFSASIIMACITYFKLWPYNVSMLIVTLIMVYLRFDVLQAGSITGVPLIGCIIVSYAVLSFYFFGFAYTRPLWQRVAAFLTLSTIWNLFFELSGGYQNPLAVAALHGLPLGMFMILFFILLNGFDLPATVFRFISASRPKASGAVLRDFSIVMVFYLGNLLLYYFHKAGLVTWDIVYLDPHFVLVVSGLVGLWNWRSRFQRFAWITESSHSLTILYLGLLLGALVGMYQLFTLGSDPLMEVLEDYLAGGLFGMGLAFWMYTLVNFFGLQVQGTLERVMYQPRFMPLIAIPSIGMTVVVILLFYAAKAQVYQTKAGLYNAQGIAWLSEGNRELGEGFINEGLRQAHRNHQGNYLLGVLALKDGKTEEAAMYFRTALQKNPSPQAYLALAQTLGQTAQVAYAVEEFKSFHKQEFSQDERLVITYAQLLEAAGRTDSAIFYNQRAGSQNELAEANALFFAYKKGDVGQVKKLIGEEKYSSSVYRANQIAIKNWLRVPIKEMALLEWQDVDTAMATDRMVLYYNAGIAGALNKDTSLSQTLAKATYTASNEPFRPFLLFARGLMLYEGGNAYQGYRLIGTAEDLKGGAGDPYTLFFGQLLLKDGAALKADEVLKDYSNVLQSESFLLRAMAQVQAGKAQSSSELWRELAASRTDTSLRIANDMLQVASAPIVPMQGQEYSDFFGRAMITTRGEGMNRQFLTAWLEIIKSPSQRMKAAADAVNILRRQGNYDEALALFSEEIKRPSPAFARADLAVAGMRIYASAGLFEELKALINQKEKLGVTQRQLLCFDAMMAKDTTMAKSLWEKATLASPLDSYTLLKAGSFYNTLNNKQKAYDILLAGLDDNVYSIELNEAYIQQCLTMNLDRFAQDALVRLKEISPVRYTQFVTQMGENLPSYLLPS